MKKSAIPIGRSDCTFLVPLVSICHSNGAFTRKMVMPRKVRGRPHVAGDKYHPRDLMGRLGVLLTACWWSCHHPEGVQPSSRHRSCGGSENGNRWNVLVASNREAIDRGEAGRERGTMTVGGVAARIIARSLRLHLHATHHVCGLKSVVDEAVHTATHCSTHRGAFGQEGWATSTAILVGHLLRHHISPKLSP